MPRELNHIKYVMAVLLSDKAAKMRDILVIETFHNDKSVNYSRRKILNVLILMKSPDI